jgi:glycosyltransferase involved in cell wall biosynthesis
VVTGHGIDCGHFRAGSWPRPVEVLTVGRLAPSKGQDELLAALALLPACPRTEIAGEILLPADAPFRERLHAAARRDFPGRVSFLGAVPWPAVADVMRRARVMVNASRTGSVDKVVLEAMACGTLPLTCNESFAPLLGPELAALLMFRQDDPADLAAGIARLLALPDADAAALGARLRAIVERDHDLSRLIPRMVGAMEPRE